MASFKIEIADQVTVADGRVIEGSFSCLDKQGNLVLSAASQLSMEGSKRFLGNVVIPAKQRKDCKLLQAAYDM